MTAVGRPMHHRTNCADLGFTIRWSCHVDDGIACHLRFGRVASR